MSEHPCHDSDTEGRPYVRLTFRPAGAPRSRTVWAVVLRRSPGRVTYLECDREGATRKDMPRGPNGEYVEQIHLIVVGSETENVVRPARLNLHYGELEIVPESKKETASNG